MSAARRLVVHIGAPKTGSTALQKFLFDNRAALDAGGWRYPDVSLRGYGHHDLAFLIGGGYPDWATAQDKPLSELAGQLAGHFAEARDIVLSSENFYLLTDPAALASTLARAGLTDSDRVTIVAYVRRQDEAHLSWYNQTVKAQGFSGSVQESLTRWQSLWDYDARLGRWASTFGAQNLVVRPYQASDLHDGDIRRDFSTLLGLPADSMQLPAETPNTRLNRDILEFQRMINRLPLTAQQKRRFHKELMELTAQAGSSGLFDDTPLLTVEERRAILRSYASGNARVARRFLGRDTLFEEAMPAGPATPAEEWKLTPEKVVYLLGWILSRA